MSIERQAKRALYRMLFWRLVGELFVLPQLLLKAVQALVGAPGSWFRNIEMAVFYLELEAARRYKLLTGLDLATAGGDPGRYGSLDPDRAEAIQNMFMQGPEDDA